MISSMTQQYWSKGLGSRFSRFGNIGIRRCVASNFKIRLLTPLAVVAAGKGDEERDTCAGGISVASANGKIVCSNTLDDRLRIAFAANLPEFRAALFGKAEY